MNALRKYFHRPAVACVIISLLVLLTVMFVRSRGWLQAPELFVYDHLVKARTKLDSKDDRIVLIGMTEEDLQRYGYALSDRILAEVLHNVGKQNPVAIGLDFYRDRDEPRSGEGASELATQLKNLDCVFGITRLDYFHGPPALGDDPARVLTNNFKKDADGVYRRAILTAEFNRSKGQDGKALSVTSLSFGVVGAYLDSISVPIAYVPQSQGAPLVRLGSTVIPRLVPDAGGYVNARVEDYEYLFDYESPRSFRVHDPNDKKQDRNTPHDYSFRQVLDEEIPEGALTGKIVFLATVMESIKDSNPTPIHDNLRGVEQHVLLTHQLLRVALDGVKPMSWWPEWAEILWIATAAMLGGIAGLLLHSPWKIVPALSLLLAALYFAGWFAFYERLWIPIAAPIAACAVAAALVLSVVAYFEGAERGLIKSMFSKHTSPAVVDALLKESAEFFEGGRIKPRRIVATILFTDLKGFSTTSEKMDPETLMDWMNEYFDGIASHVERNGGIIDKFIGDAIMGVFGVPLARTSEEELDADAINAVECALAMRTALASLNAAWREEGRPTTAMRIGIHTGRIVAGHLGSADRVDYTVLGDTVNTAARLEAAGKDFGDDAECSILISDATCARLRGGYATRLLGPITLKGKAEQVIVHSVISSTKEPTAK